MSLLLLMDDSEPVLPPHPEVESEAARAPRPSLFTRKRTYDASVYEGENSTATSSDPALFSGDEQESVGAEDYTGKRKKKMYTGSWWSHHVKAGKEDRKKEFKRNFDSGIFMGSDSEPPSSDSFTSLDDELVRDQARADSTAAAGGQSLRRVVAFLEGPDYATPLARRTGRQSDEDMDTTPRKRFIARRNEDHDDQPDTSPKQCSQLREALRIIHQCLEDGQENVDLSGCALSELPVEIGELAHLTKQTNFVVGMLESGASLETHLRLFLGNNFLRQLPLSLLSLTNLRELSLRRNKLTSLPAGIRELVNLEKLNVSGNKLSYLPFEVINLVAHHRLRELTTEPNLWETTHEDQVDLARYSVRKLQLEPRQGLQMGICLGRAVPVSVSGSTLATTSSAVPSLSEVVLRQLARIQPLDDLQQLMPRGTPHTVLASLERLDQTLQQGGQSCNRCGRLMVCPGVEWVELWRVHHTYIPIRRVQCTSQCEGTATRWCDAPC